MSNDWDLVQLFGAVLDLCKVESGETLAVLTEGGDYAEYAGAFLVAAQERGAASFQVNVAKRFRQPGSGPKRTSLSGNAAAVKALKTADIVIDHIGLLWSAEQKELQESGLRILSCRESAENIVRMFPRPELRRRVEDAATMLGSARKMRITSAAGTDISYQLGQYRVVTQYGYTDEPGRWDNLPGGFLYTGGNDGEIDGVVVLAPGDVLLVFRRYVNSPIRLIVERGQVTRIEGDNTDAQLLRDYMARWNDPRAYAVSHIGWGMDEKANWDYLASGPAVGQTGRDGRAFCGNVLFSTGPNSELGGTNDTDCHLDLPLRGCTLMLDDRTIVEHGKIVPPELTA